MLVKWVGNDGIMKKIIDFCHFEFWESEKIPVKTIRNGHFKPIFMRFFATNSGAKTYMGRSYHQINFLLQNIINGDEMKASKPLTPHGMHRSCLSKVHFCCLGTLKMKILKGLAQNGQWRLNFTQLFVLISNFELRIINIDLAVPIRGETGDWIVV